METLVDYLNKIREMSGSDYKTAKMLEIKPPSIVAIRKGGKIKDETAIRIAKILNIDECKLLIDLQIEKSQGDVKASWIKVKEKIAMH